MTPTEWDEIAGVLWGDIDSALQEVRRVLLRVRHETTLVYGQCELVPRTGAPGRNL